MDFAAVILAAGKSKRMKSALPKPIHPICGKPVTRHVIDACKEAGIDQIVVVVGHEAETVKSVIGDDVLYALQSEQKGTGHAAMQAMPLIDKKNIVLLPGDAPLISSENIKKLMEKHVESGAAATLLTSELEDAGAYGRIVRDENDKVKCIVEARDATTEEIKIKEISTSMYCFNTDLLKKGLGELKTDNAQGEYYLTDTISVFQNMGHTIEAFVADDYRETLGINTRIELSEATAIMQRRILDALMLDGVTMIDPNSTYIDSGVTIGQDSIVHPCTVITGASKIGNNCVIGPFTKIDGSTIGNNVQVISSHVSKTNIEDGAIIGPLKVID